ncbi:hypothetical protein D3Z51_09065 [Clostridiaceae bacterium]|nr:hypothetical protein [Clostridiaceae bacterium]RKI14407.1 hypothetical protein D7V81_08550 [bacterium 1XD21-70]
MITYLEEPAITQLVDDSFANILGGNNITKALEKQLVTFNDPMDEINSKLSLFDATINNPMLADPDISMRDLADGFARPAGTREIMSRIAGHVNMGKFFAPLPGNWH